MTTIYECDEHTAIYLRGAVRILRGGHAAFWSRWLAAPLRPTVKRPGGAPAGIVLGSSFGQVRSGQVRSGQLYYSAAEG